MKGRIAKALVEAIRDSKLVDESNISVVLSNDNGEGTVNTALPAVAINVRSTDNSVQAIGGLIMDRYIIQVSVITEFDNQAASPDEDFQYNQMDLHYLLKIYLYWCMRGEMKLQDGTIKKLPYFDEIRATYDFNMVYKDVESYQRIGRNSEMGDIEVFIDRLIYTANWTNTEIIDGAISLPLESIDMNCRCDEIRADEQP